VSDAAVGVVAAFVLLRIQANPFTRAAAYVLVSLALEQLVIIAALPLDTQGIQHSTAYVGVVIAARTIRSVAVIYFVAIVAGWIRKK